MEEKGLYKAMGELDLLFNYIETYLASKRHKNNAWRAADRPQACGKETSFTPFLLELVSTPVYELLCSETSAELNCPEDKFSDHIVSLRYISDCHLKYFIYFFFIYIIYDEYLLLNKAVDTDDWFLLCYCA